MIASVCCHAEIVKGSRTEFPLGGSTWGQHYSVEVCSECGKEAEETVTLCEVCGEITCDCREDL